MKIYLTYSLSLLTLVSSMAIAQPESIKTEAGTLEVEDLTGGLDHPWGMAFLPDGRLLVTERAGTLRILSKDGKLSEPVQGAPNAVSGGQGGMLDVALDPDFASNQLVYLSFTEGGEGGTSTALGRGKLEQDRLRDFKVIFSQKYKVDNTMHFGGRIVFTPDGKLYLTMGERNKFDPAQELSNHLGTIVRLNTDGSVPKDNPFINQEDALPEIWSYGHRNIESAAIDPKTGSLWIAEMGPKDGDELNRPEAGRNHGWPLVSWGNHYDGRKIPDPTTKPELTDAVMQWTPVISPSGMIFYTGDMFPQWQGSALIGGLSAKAVVRVKVEGNKASEVERIALKTRIRDVEQAPDGSVYVLTDEDDGHVWRLKLRQKQN